MKYKITWNTKELRDNGFDVYDLKLHLENYGCTVNSFDGGRIFLTTNKSIEGLFQEIRRVFGLETKIIETSVGSIYREV